MLINKNLIYTISTRFLTAFAAFITSIITARYLGPEERGNYFFIMTVCNCLAQLGNFGLQSSNTYLVANQKALLPKLITNSFWISFLSGSFLSLLVLFVMQWLHNQNIQPSLWFAIILVPTLLFYSLGINLLIGIQKIHAFNSIQIGSNLLLIFFALLAGIFNANSNGFLLSTSLSWTVSVGILFFILHNKQKISWSFDYPIFRQGLGYATKAYITLLLGLLVAKSNVFFLKSLTNNTLLGHFSIAAQMSDALAIIPTTIGLLLFPRLIQNKTSRWQEMKKNLLAMIGIMLILCLIAGLLAKIFIKFVFGTNFLPATDIFLWMLPGTFFLGLTSIVSQFLSAHNFPVKMIYVWLTTFVLVIALSWKLIPLFLGIGAAIALSIAYFCIFCLLLALALQVKKTTNQTATI